MLPTELIAEHFRRYPPQARKLVTAHLDSLRRLPLSFVPSLLREVIGYDWKFPAERKEQENQLEVIRSLSRNQMREWFQGFANIKLSPQLEQLDWVNLPGEFVEKLSSDLWTTHQVDEFHRAALEYSARLQAAAPPEQPPVARLGMAVIGQGAGINSYPLFRKLRPHGVRFTRVHPGNGMKMLLAVIAERSTKYPAQYGHWYIDGGEALEHDSSVACISYQGLAVLRSALLQRMESQIQSAGMGPEKLRTILSEMRPEDLGLRDLDDPVLNRFQVSVLTEGSGTQIFSTTFAQWAAREALRRAQPLTMLVRFAPRQRLKPMNELLSANHSQAEIDAEGSIVDADMGAYYNWLNQQRLSGAEQSSFLVWFEDHNEALAIGPSMPRGTDSSSPVTVGDLVKWIT
jgi:hypothetical protein